MIFLYFVLDVCFYNFTSFKTDILLHSLLDKNKHTWVYFVTMLFIDFLLLAHGKFFLLYTILFFINKKIKYSYQSIGSLYKRFLFLYFLYKIVVFLLFSTFGFEVFGFGINLLILFVTHKKS